MYLQDNMTKEELQIKSLEELIQLCTLLKGFYCLCNTPWKGGWYCASSPDATIQTEGSTAQEAIINLYLLSYEKSIQENTKDENTIDSGK